MVEQARPIGPLFVDADPVVWPDRVVHVEPTLLVRFLGIRRDLGHADVRVSASTRRCSLRSNHSTRPSAPGRGTLQPPSPHSHGPIPRRFGEAVTGDLPFDPGFHRVQGRVRTFGTIPSSAFPEGKEGFCALRIGIV